MSQERSLLPDTQNLVEHRKNKKVMEAAIYDLVQEEKYLKQRMRDIATEKRDLQYHHYAMQAGGGKNEEVEKKKFIMGCPGEECRGFLSQAWKCGICDVYVCSKCRCVKEGRDDETHVCDPDAVATAIMLKEETKPCPSCAIPIFKISGCPQMWCQHEDTPIWMWSGEKKIARDIIVGDMLIGDDGMPRWVDTLTSGHDDMYLVSQRFGDNYKVIGGHLLTLKYKGKVVDISVEDYMSRVTARQNRYYHRVAVDCINWPSQTVLLNPYILGMWLGDGTSRGDGFSSQDVPLVKKWVDWGICEDIEITHGRAYGYDIRNKYQGKVDPVGWNSMKTCHGCKFQPSVCCASIDELHVMLESDPENVTLNELLEWRIQLPARTTTLLLGKARTPNRFMAILDMYGLRDNKHIPLVYLQNTLDVRLQVLAGIIDTDGNKSGNSYRVSQSIKRHVLCENIVDMANSLGLATKQTTHDPDQVTFPHGKTYTGSQQIKVRIMGDTSRIPVVLEYKKVHGKGAYPTSTISVTPCGQARYVGWSVSGGTPRYLLGDGTVTHNCTECHTTFSWNTGKIETGVVHNPHFYQWQRDQNGGVAPRVPGDGPLDVCGGLPMYQTVSRVMHNRGDEIPLWENMHRAVNHIRHVVTPRYPATRRQADNSDLRVSFLMKDITEAHWLKQLQMRQKRSEKCRDVYQILDMLTNALTDMFTRYVSQPVDLAMEGEALRQYVNRELQKVKMKYSNRTPFISIIWDVR